MVEGCWVVGIVQRLRMDKSGERELVCVEVENRNAETLINIVDQHVRPGTRIISDCWCGYDEETLKGLGYHMNQVNHSIEYVNSETGAHTICIVYV